MLRRTQEAIRSLTSQQALVKMARVFRIAGALKRWEYRLRGPSGGVVRHAVGGVEVVLAAPDATEFRTVEHCFAGEMDFVEALAKKLRTGGVYYDIGSNIGQFLILAAKVVGERGQAVGFEPHPVNHQRLLRNVALNGLTNVRVFQVALGDRNSEIQIYGARGLATVVPRAAAWHQTSPVATVQAMRGDTLRAHSGLPIPTAVKIHVEGAEFGVLSGLKETLSSPLCELLCLVIHPPLLPAEVSVEKVLSLVRSFGFNRAETRPCEIEMHVIAEKVQAQS